MGWSRVSKDFDSYTLTLTQLQIQTVFWFDHLTVQQLLRYRVDCHFYVEYYYYYQVGFLSVQSGLLQFIDILRIRLKNVDTKHNGQHNNTVLCGNFQVLGWQWTNINCSQSACSQQTFVIKIVPYLTHHVKAVMKFCEIFLQTLSNKSYWTMSSNLINKVSCFIKRYI